MAAILYIIVPCYNEEAVLPITAPMFLTKINGLAAVGKISPESRVMFVNDGSRDRPTTTAPKAATYTVKSGDCLWNIAKKQLGNGADYTKIYNLNKDKIKNPNLIYPGQVLTLPS